MLPSRAANFLKKASAHAISITKIPYVLHYQKQSLTNSRGILHFSYTADPTRAKFIRAVIEKTDPLQKRVCNPFGRTKLSGAVFVAANISAVSAHAPNPQFNRTFGTSDAILAPDGPHTAKPAPLFKAWATREVRGPDGTDENEREEGGLAVHEATECGRLYRSDLSAGDGATCRRIHLMYRRLDLPHRPYWSATGG